MGGRHKNFEDPMPYELRKRINKFRNVTFFMGHPLITMNSYIIVDNSDLINYQLE